MAQRRAPRARLTAVDWADAALAAMREGGGLSAVAVEPLAVRLGTTKGSFYWHFANREALVQAALCRWEELAAERVDAAQPATADLTTRLRALFREVTTAPARDRLELTLLAHADHPQVSAVLRRVTARRLAHLARLFGEYGLPEDEAHRRALLAYCGYLGHAQLAHAVPSALPSGADAPAYLEAVLASLLPAPTSPPTSAGEPAPAPEPEPTATPEPG